MRFALVLALLCLPSLAAAQIAPSITFDGCVDAAGQAVPARLAPAQAAFVETRSVQGRPELHYNPQALASRGELTRAFLFAQACARLNLGLPPLLDSPAAVRRADCWGLAMLMRSGLVTDEREVARIQADLDLGAGEWQRLPGPVRSFELAACTREALRLPSLRPAGLPQDALNACLHRCGDRLFRCQRGALSAGGECIEAFDRCEAGCGAP